MIPPSAGLPRALDQAVRTDTGLQRSENQDAHGSWSDASGRHLLLVADGLGGHRGGATASRLAVGAFRDVFAARVGCEAPELLLEAFEVANARIHTASRDDPDLDGMGTTGVALLLELGGGDPRAWIAHVGDSRAYRVRRSELEILTLDHTLRAQLRETRGLDTAEIDGIPGADALIRALGTEPDIRVEIRPLDVEPGDAFLLCSDGLWGSVPIEETASILARGSLAERVDALVDEANRRGGPDNITVQLAAVPPHASQQRTRGRGPGWDESSEPRLEPIVGLGIPVVAGSRGAFPSMPPIPPLRSAGGGREAWLLALRELRRRSWAIPLALFAATLTAFLIAGLLL